MFSHFSYNLILILCVLMYCRYYGLMWFRYLVLLIYLPKALNPNIIDELIKKIKWID